MQYVRIERGLLTWSVSTVGSEAEATHVALKLVEHERAQASRDRAELAQALNTLRQEGQRVKAEYSKAMEALKRAREEISALREAKAAALREKANWRRRALAGVGLGDPEDEQRYERDRHEQWWRVVTMVLDVDGGDEGAALAIEMATAAAKQAKGIPSKVWRNKGIWHCQMRVPAPTAGGLGRGRVRMEAAEADTRQEEFVQAVTSEETDPGPGGRNPETAGIGSRVEPGGSIVLA
jgi:hypothetical protein